MVTGSSRKIQSVINNFRGIDVRANFMRLKTGGKANIIYLYKKQIFKIKQQFYYF